MVIISGVPIFRIFTVLHIKQFCTGTVILDMISSLMSMYIYSITNEKIRRKIQAAIGEYD